MKLRLPTIRSALEFRRKEYGWNKGEMAKALGLARTHYSEVIKGKRQLPVRARCKAFEIGVPAEVLLQTLKTKRLYEERMNSMKSEGTRKSSTLPSCDER